MVVLTALGGMCVTLATLERSEIQTLSEFVLTMAATSYNIGATLTVHITLSFLTQNVEVRLFPIIKSSLC